MNEENLIYGASPDPQAWGEIDSAGRLIYFNEAKAREFVAVNGSMAPQARVACLVLGVLAAERERAPFSKVEFLEV